MKSGRTTVSHISLMTKAKDNIKASHLLFHQDSSQNTTSAKIRISNNGFQYMPVVITRSDNSQGRRFCWLSVRADRHASATDTEEAKQCRRFFGSIWFGALSSFKTRLLED